MRRALGAGSLVRIAPHITLVPPVNVSDGEVEAALEVCRSAAGQSAPIAVMLGPTATFWPTTPVVYLEVRGDIASMVELRTALLLGPLEGPERKRERAFVPHVTLDQHASPDSIAAAVTVLKSYQMSYIFETVTILEQDEVNRWVPIADFRLGRPRVVGRGGLEVELSVVSMLDEVTARFAGDEWDAYSRTQYGREFEADDPFAVVARREGAVVGMASGEVRGSVCELARLIVGRALRGQGIGSQLVRAVELMAGERGCERVRLRTIAGGPAEAFYLSRGYRPEATLPAWRGGLDFVVLSRVLSRS